MKPTRDDIAHLVVALFTVMASLDRARRRIPAANTLGVLQAVAARDGVRPSEIATELGVHQSSVTRQVQALEDAGHVLVTADPDDGRAHVVRITDVGQVELGRLTQVGMDRFMAFVADWEADEVRTLARLLTRFEESKAALARHEQQSTGRRRQRET